MILREFLISKELDELVDYFLTLGVEFTYEASYNHKRGREEYVVSWSRDDRVLAYTAFHISNQDLEAFLDPDVRGVFVQTMKDRYHDTVRSS